MRNKAMEGAQSKMYTNDSENIKVVREKQVCQKLYSNKMVTTVPQNYRARQHQLLVKILDFDHKNGQ